MPTFKTGMYIELIVEYEYEPYEAPTHDCPGQQAQANIIEVKCTPPEMGSPEWADLEAEAYDHAQKTLAEMAYEKAIADEDIADRRYHEMRDERRRG